MWPWCFVFEFGQSFLFGVTRLYKVPCRLSAERIKAVNHKHYRSYYSWCMRPLWGRFTPRLAGDPQEPLCIPTPEAPGRLWPDGMRGKYIYKSQCPQFKSNQWPLLNRSHSLSISMWKHPNVEMKAAFHWCRIRIWTSCSSSGRFSRCKVCSETLYFKLCNIENITYQTLFKHLTFIFNFDSPLKL